MNRNLAFFCLLMFATGITFAQQTPELFQPGIISNGGVFGFTLSPDSRVALWVLSNGKRDTLKIMESRKTKGKWSAPQVASFSTASGAWKDIDPVFSPDGKKALFQSTRNTHRTADRKDFDIWAVEVTSTGWSEPYPLAGEINSEVSESYASITKDGTVYFMKENDNNTGRSDIYFSELKAGKYQKPQNIGMPVNTTERESNPFIAADGSYIIYFSSDTTGLGDVDLVISFKNNNKWTAPKNLGAPINSERAEFCPFVHTKEKRLYFARQRKAESGRMEENIYSVNFDVSQYR